MTDDQFEKLTQLINGSHEDLSSRIDGLDTRIADLDYRTNENFMEIRSELKTINKRLGTVEEKVDNMVGVTKEVDYILSEITTIKSYVGMVTEA